MRRSLGRRIIPSLDGSAERVPVEVGGVIVVKSFILMEPLVSLQWLEMLEEIVI